MELSVQGRALCSGEGALFKQKGERGLEAEIVVRKARRLDVPAIWHLLHNENLAWDDQRILQELDYLHLLTYGNKLLCILHGSFVPGPESISFVAVHPMYPEGTLRAAIIHALAGVLCRRPGSDVERLGRSRGVMEKILDIRY